MSPLPFGPVSPFAPRRFLPETIDLGAWAGIAPLFDRLDQQLRQAQSPADIEQFLLDWGELSAALEEEGSRRYIAMTCHTDDPEAEQRYLQFVEGIEPLVKPRHFALEQTYLGHPAHGLLPHPRYTVFNRNTRVQVELFREENIPLETEEARLGQQYQKLMGALTVRYRDEERTLVQMGRYQEETDRPTRQEAWELVVQRRLREAERIDHLFDSLLATRRQLAQNAGYPVPRDYYFRRLARFDYTPTDCERFHDAVEETVMPMLRRRQGERCRQLGLPALRPWDLAVDPHNRAPLRPFETSDQLVGRTQRIFDALDPGLAADFHVLQDRHLLDLDNRIGKAPGGYQSTLAESRLPFIFMNAVGQQRDVETLLHEAGHAFHALACAEEPLHAYRSAIPIEFCEVASMSMELLSHPFLEAFYPRAEARRARKVHLEGILGVLPWIATIDAFQHWIYTHPDANRDDRITAWLALLERFGDDVDWTGYADARARLWHRQLHLFLYPFYYIEYGIAQLGALQVWARAAQDRPAALQAYRAALALGGSRPLPELFTTAGCRFDFGPSTLRPLMERLGQELDELDEA